MTLKVLQIHQSDLLGSRFQNFAIRELLGEHGIDSRHLVWNPLSDDPSVGRIFDFPLSRWLNEVIGKVERHFSLHSVLQLQSMLLPISKWFREADVIHYHVVHDGYFSILAMPLLSRLKPTIWTWHDPWIMTGHCIYPLECSRWEIGCGSCPQLHLPFEMSRDRTALQFKQKRWVVEHSDLEVVVASKYMQDMARRSPIGRDARLHRIPFGIDLSQFCPTDPTPARRRLGILDGRVVVGVRSFESPFKGYNYFLEALAQLETSVPLCILTTHGRGQLNDFIGKHQIVELGWVNDDELLLDSFRATDFFVMPSTDEAFGMMAIEAMACGKPIIVFEGTSLPEITFSPEAGLAVPARDTAALARAIRHLAENAAERAQRGATGRRLAEQHYDARTFASELAGLYAEVALRQSRLPSSA